MTLKKLLGHKNRINSLLQTPELLILWGVMVTCSHTGWKPQPNDMEWEKRLAQSGSAGKGTICRNISHSQHCTGEGSTAVMCKMKWILCLHIWISENYCCTAEDSKYTPLGSKFRCEFSWLMHAGFFPTIPLFLRTKPAGLIAHAAVSPHRRDTWTHAQRHFSHFQRNS